jgi:hypothetical protein
VNVNALLGSDKLTSTSVVSGDRVPNAEIFATNGTGSGAATRPIARYSSLGSGTTDPGAGKGVVGSGLTLEPVLLHAIIIDVATVARTKNGRDELIGMSG